MYGDPKWEFETLTNGNGATVDAAVVTEETAYVEGTDGVKRPAEVRTVDAVKRVRAGDVLVRTNQPDVYDVHGRDAFAEMGFRKGSSGAPTVDTTEDDEEPATENVEDFHADDHTVAEIKSFLDRNPDQRDRIHEEERAGSNRASVFK